MLFEKKLKKDLNDTFKVENHYEQVIKHIDFDNQNTKENYFMKKRTYIFALASVVLIGGIGTAFLVNNNLNANKPTSLITVDVNPSVQFTLNKKNKVISVSGENNEGKMIIADEDLIGKSFEEALKIVLTIENETGYLTKADFEVNENQISFSITCDNENIQKTLENTITNTVDKIKDELNYDELVVKINEYTREQLEEYAVSCDSSYTQEEIDNFSNEQLLAIISNHHIETYELFTSELEDLYIKAKEYEVKFAEEEATKEIISKMGSAYQIVLNGYDTMLNVMREGIDEINQIRYERLIAEDSDYQIALNKVLDAKKEVLNLKSEISKLYEEGKDVDAYLKTLEVKEEVLQLAIDTLITCKDVVINLIDHVVERIELAYNTFKEIRDKLISSEELEQRLQDNAKTLEGKINLAKDNFFKKFEEAHKDDINRIKEEVLSYKEELKETIKGA